MKTLLIKLKVIVIALLIIAAYTAVFYVVFTY